MNVVKKLETFAKITEEEAEKRRKALLLEIDEKLAKTLDEYKEEIEAAAKSKLNLEENKAAQIFSKEVSIYEGEMRKNVFLKRLAYETELFESVEKALADFIETQEYINSLVSVLAEEADRYPGSSVILTEKDMNRIVGLSGAQKYANNIIVSDEDFIGGYKIILAGNKKVIDNTYKLKLEDAKAGFKGLKV